MRGRDYIRKSQASEEFLLRQLKYKPPAPKPLSSGSAYAPGYMYPGITIPAADGARFVATYYSKSVIFVIKDKIFEQDFWAFSDDIRLSGIQRAAKTAAIWPVVHKWMMVGIATGVGGFAPWVLLAGDILTNLPKGTSLKELLSKLGRGIAAIITARQILKTIAPVFYDKLLVAFLLGTGKNLPNVTTAGDVIKLLISIIGTFWKRSFKTRIKFWWAFVSAAKKTLIKVIALIPRAASKQAKTYIDRTKSVVQFLKDVGVKVSKKEEVRISNEFATSSDSILQVLTELHSDLPEFK